MGWTLRKIEQISVSTIVVWVIVTGAPAIDELVVVGMMLRDFGICTLIV